MIEAALLAAAVAAGAAQTAVQTAATSASFHALLDEDWEARLREDPLLATATGDHRYDDRLPSVAPADLERAAQRQRARWPVCGTSRAPAWTRRIASATTCSRPSCATT